MKVLIIGFGSIAKKHVQALKDLGYDATIYALRSEKSAESHEGIIDLYSITDAPDDIDFVIISTPTSIHLDSIKTAITLGKPLFIEKPLVRYVEEIETLSTLNFTLSTTYIACVLRHHPCIQFVKDSLGDLNIKTVEAYCGSYMPDWVQGADWKKSFRANAAMSGGVHLELIHELDYCYWLFGAPQSTTSTLRESGELGIAIVDDAQYELKYKNFTADISVNYLDREPRRTLSIAFDDGPADAPAGAMAGKPWEVDLLKFRITENDEEVFFSEMTMADVYASQMQYFLNCLHEGSKPMNSVHEASEVLTLALS